MVCSFCGVHVWPRVGAYWFLLLTPRGRCRFPGTPELRLVLCSGCGRRARELLIVNGYGLEVELDTAGKSDSAGVSGPGAHRDDRASGDPELVGGAHRESAG
jgi:hypothetical protein